MDLTCHTGLRRLLAGTAAALTAAATTFLASTPAQATPKKDAGPDLCATGKGTASYQPSVDGLLAFSTTDLGTQANAPDYTLCVGYTYVLTLSSADGQGLGWSTASTNADSVSDNGSSVTFAITPSTPTQMTVQGSTTNASSPDECGGEPGILGTLVITHYDKKKLVETDWITDKPLCFDPNPLSSPGGNYFG